MLAKEASRAKGSADPKKPDSDGRVLVSFPVESHEVSSVVARLDAKMTSDGLPEGGEFPLGFSSRQWSERSPETRMQVFEKVLGRWNNPDQEPILRSVVMGFSADLRAGDLLPFQLLTFVFKIKPLGVNRSDHLTFAADKCESLARSFSGLSPGSKIIVTSEALSRGELDGLFRDLERANDGARLRNQRTGTDPLFHPPAGLGILHKGVSHLRLAYNLHAVLAPLGSSSHGMGWVVHIYEEPGHDGRLHWGPKAVELIDPIRAGWGAFIEKRLSGLPMLFASWDWFYTQRHATRVLRKDLLAHEGRLSKPLLHPSALISWRHILKRDSEARCRVHQFRALRDECEPQLTDFLDQLHGKHGLETWIVPKGHRPVQPNYSGPIRGLLQEFMRELRQGLAFAEENWDLAVAQKESYKVRLERFLGIAVLLLTVVGTVELALRYL